MQCNCWASYSRTPQPGSKAREKRVMTRILMHWCRPASPLKRPKTGRRRTKFARNLQIRAFCWKIGPMELLTGGEHEERNNIAGSKPAACRLRHFGQHPGP